MKVSTEAKLFVIRKKLLEAERTIYEANKILANIGDEFEPVVTTFSGHDDSRDIDSSDPITGLYPGQIPDVKQIHEEEAECET